MSTNEDLFPCNLSYGRLELGALRYSGLPTRCRPAHNFTGQLRLWIATAECSSHELTAL